MQDGIRLNKFLSIKAALLGVRGTPSTASVCGSNNGDHAITGTEFDPASAKTKQQPLELWLTQHLRPDVAFSFETVQHPEGRLVLLTIPSATTAPIEFDRTAFVRIGEATPRLADHPDRQRAMWDKLRPYVWAAGIARGFLEGEQVLDLLDCDAY